MRFYIVMIMVNAGLTIADVQAALGNNVPWYRIANNVWIVHTNLGSAWLYNLLAPLAHPTGSLLISHLDPTDKQGWMNQSVWNWIDERIPQGV